MPKRAPSIDSAHTGGSRAWESEDYDLPLPGSDSLGAASSGEREGPFKSERHVNFNEERLPGADLQAFEELSARLVSALRRGRLH
jgi:hypothetical protein